MILFETKNRRFRQTKGYLSFSSNFINCPLLTPFFLGGGLLFEFEDSVFHLNQLQN